MSDGYPQIVDVRYERFSVEASFTCPECGEKLSWLMEPWDVYDLLEGLANAECPTCGARFLLFDGDSA